MTKVVGVRFKDTGKTYYFDPKGLEIKKGDLVVVETARGMECGVAQYAPKEVAENEVTAPLKPVLRIATARDKQILEENKEKEKRAYEVCLQKIEKHKLDMNLTEVEYAFDGSKILFYFTADGRILENWSRIWPPLSIPVLSCARSACETRPRCWAVWACAGGRFAALPS